MKWKWKTCFILAILIAFLAMAALAYAAQAKKGFDQNTATDTSTAATAMKAGAPADNQDNTATRALTAQAGLKMNLAEAQEAAISPKVVWAVQINQKNTEASIEINIPKATMDMALKVQQAYAAPRANDLYAAIAVNNGNTGMSVEHTAAGANDSVNASVEYGTLTSGVLAQAIGWSCGANTALSRDLAAAKSGSSKKSSAVGVCSVEQPACAMAISSA
jgi:hypothetical protein